jgi:hypothetical protein
VLSAPTAKNSEKPRLSAAIFFIDMLTFAKKIAALRRVFSGLFTLLWQCLNRNYKNINSRIWRSDSG